jgi:hypothetical protein
MSPLARSARDRAIVARPVRRARWRAVVIAAAILMPWSLPVVSAGAPAPVAVSQEYQLKAAFLFNFASYVEWPADAFATANSPITIGVLGDDPFGSSLDDLVAGETIRNRSLVVRRYRSVEEVADCHILFVSPSEASQMDHIVDVLAHRSVLTVGDTRDFAVHAGIIGFELVQRRLHLQINLAAATGARLVISSKLLRQARIVGPKEGRE